MTQHFNCTIEFVPYQRPGKVPLFIIVDGRPIPITRRKVSVNSLTTYALAAIPKPDEDSLPLIDISSFTEETGRQHMAYIINKSTVEQLTRQETIPNEGMFNLNSKAIVVIDKEQQPIETVGGKVTLLSREKFIIPFRSPTDIGKINEIVFNARKGEGIYNVTFINEAFNYQPLIKSL